MLHQTACRGRLEALLHDNNFENAAASQLAKILEPDNSDRSSSTHIMSDVEIANAHASATRLDQQHYDLLLEYLNATGKQYHSAYKVVPQILGTLILPPVAHYPRQFNFDNHTYSVNEDKGCQYGGIKGHFYH